MIWGSKCYKNKNPVACDGYEEEQISTYNGAGGLIRMMLDQQENALEWRTMQFNFLIFWRRLGLVIRIKIHIMALR